MRSWDSPDDCHWQGGLNFQRARGIFSSIFLLSSRAFFRPLSPRCPSPPVLASNHYLLFTMRAYIALLVCVLIAAPFVLATESVRCTHCGI
jgi:hypothetical protein